MVKNCGDNVHFHIADRNILQDMIKFVKKKADIHVKDKMLVLLDSWQEAFGGPEGKYPQYYWAYEELRHSGVVFPQRSFDTAPIITPPASHSTPSYAQASYGMPINSSTKLEEAMAAEMENLSLSSINSMRNVSDLLADMLQALNPGDRESVKDEIIIHLVNQCRSNQKKLMQMLTTTGDEELLGRGLELNDSLQIVLVKHDALASGFPLPTEASSSNSKFVEAREISPKSNGGQQPSKTPDANPSAPAVTATKDQVEDEEDDFALLARRHSKTRPTTSQDTSLGTSESVTSLNSSNNAVSSMPVASVPVPCNALVVSDPPVPVRITTEQDMIDFLTLTLSTVTASPETPHTTATASQNIHPSVSTIQGYPNADQASSSNQGQVPFNSYVAPWAQPQHQPQALPKPHAQSYSPLQVEPQPKTQQQLQPRLQSPLPLQPQTRPQCPLYSSGYPPPPWAPTPGYLSSQNHLSTTRNPYSSLPTNTSYSLVEGGRQLEHYGTFPVRASNGGLPMNGEPRVSYGPRTPTPAGGQKPFVPSYRLFEDLNILGNGDSKFKMTSSTSGLPGVSNQSMVGGRK
ncbi:TOM1-like protein 6 isoform X2 [Diospyros lotus]|nr:TOM1-like protein 6 isoform X2 [Diospyros lotus]